MVEMTPAEDAVYEPIQRSEPTQQLKPPEQEFKVLTKVTLKEKLGDGNFGEVFRGGWSGTEVALKKLKTSQLADALIKEASVLAKLAHPNIVQVVIITF